MKISEIAKQATGYFETATRDSGEQFTRVVDDTPEWVRDMIQDAHGDFMPDDWRYSMIERVLSEIAESDCEDASDAHDILHEITDRLTDVYTGNLVAWMGSNLNRTGYVDEAVDALGYPERIVAAMQYGQMAEYEEIAHSVIASLEARLEAVEAE